MRSFLMVAGAFGALASIGCADDLSARDEDDGILGGGEGKVQTVRNEDATYTTKLDSYSVTEWTAIDFDLGVEALETEPTWDVSVQRFHFKLNPGGGTAAVQVMELGDVALAKVDGEADGTWLTDQPDGADDNTTPDYALEQGEGWYDYDSMTHVLTPRPVTWLLKTGDGALRALRIENYYDDAGNSGRFQLRWRPLRADVADVTEVATAAAPNGELR